MTLNKCYTETFDEAMKARGFLRKGVLFYRLHGEILQGIVLKTINPYDICFTYFPYWTFRFQREQYPLKSGYWAEMGQSFSGEYYRKTNEEAAKETMKKCLAVVTEKLIPMLDQITDINSYLRAVLQTNYDFIEKKKKRLGEMVSYFGTFTGEIMGTQQMSSHALLKKAYDDNSFEGANSILQELLELRYEDVRMVHSPVSDEETQAQIREHVEMLLDMIPDMTPEQAREDAERIYKKPNVDLRELYAKEEESLRRQYEAYFQCMDAGDLNRIVGVYQEECEAMRELLLSELKIKISE